MKFLIVLSALLISTQSFADQAKCYETAKAAAFKYAVENESVGTMDEFGMQFGNENIEVAEKKGWQKEYWAFGDGSMFINVVVDSVKNKCIVKQVFMAQDDQDEHE